MGLDIELERAGMEIVLDAFRRLNYRVVDGVLNPANYGVPQFRERLILIGSRDHEDVLLPQPTHFQYPQDPRYRWVTLGDAIQHLEKSAGECGQFSETTQIFAFDPRRSRLAESSECYGRYVFFRWR